MKKFIVTLLLVFSMVTNMFPVMTATAAQSNQVEAFVERLYSILLDREVDTDGLEYWTNVLVDQLDTGAAVASNIILGEEFTSKTLTDLEFLNRMYRTVFDRLPDEGGREYWLGVLAAGEPRTTVSVNLLNSAEFGDVCEEYGITQGEAVLPGSGGNGGVGDTPEEMVQNFVKRLYSILLNREVDPTGLEYWSNILSSRLDTGAAVASNIIFSEELTNRDLSDEEYITRLYKTVFDREPDPTGLSYWVGVLEQGEPRNYVGRDLLNSAEFGDVCERYDIEQGRVTSVPEVTPPEESEDEITRMTVQEKMDYFFELLHTLPEFSSDPTYFTVNRRACLPERQGGHGYGCTNCNAADIIQASWFKELFGTLNVRNFPKQTVNANRVDWTGQSCFGFACLLQWYIYADTVDENIIGEHVNTVKFTKANMKAYVQPGDVLRFYHDEDGGHHSVVVYEVKDDGVVVYDSNWSTYNGREALNCVVQKHNVSYTGYYAGDTVYVNRVTKTEELEEGMAGLYYGADVDEGGSGEPSSPTITPDGVMLDGFPGTGTVVTANGLGLNVRSDAGTQASRIGEIPNGSKVTLLSVKLSPTGEYWYQISANVGGTTISGYVSSEFIVVKTNTAIVPPTGQITVQEKMDYFLDIIGAGNGGTVYFTVNQGPCNTTKWEPTHQCPNCNMADIIETTWFKNIFGNLSSTSLFPYHTALPKKEKDWTGQSCFGFACFLHWYLYANSVTDMKEGLVKVEQFTFTKENVERYVEPGDAIRINGHSVIVYEVVDDGIIVIDSNWSNDLNTIFNCAVTKHIITYTGSYGGKTAYLDRVRGQEDFNGMAGTYYGVSQ